MAAQDTSDAPTAPKTPFTIVTGFLGAGKTTLINYILTERAPARHGAGPARHAAAERAGATGAGVSEL